MVIMSISFVRTLCCSFQHAVGHSPQLWAVPLPTPDEGDGNGSDDDGLGVGLGRL